jgi:hypothetical protein
VTDTSSETSSDTSSKGLLPQLIEVLAALTESQDLLTRKVQQLRQERQRTGSDVGVPADTASAQSPVSQGASEQLSSVLQPVDGQRDPTVGAFAQTMDDPSRPTAEVVFTVEPPATETSLVDANDGETRAHAETQRNDRADGRPSASRDYNFFDDLDARLAAMDDRTGHPRSD